MPRQHRSVTDVGPGDYVKLADHRYERIRSVNGVDENGRLLPPSQGGFSVTTEDGKVIDMRDAKSYHKAEDMLDGEV